MELPYGCTGDSSDALEVFLECRAVPSRGLCGSCAYIYCVHVMV
jgi:hypothetical protein